MPFGLCNAPAAFQRWINEVLMEHIDMCCIVYLDDVLIYSNTPQQHRKDVSNILEAIRKSGMKVKPSKCEFHEKRNRIPRIYHWTGRGQDRPSQDTSYLGLDDPQENQGYPMFPRLLQLLPTIHRRFQQDGQTLICKNKKGMHWQMGMGRQRTTSFRRIKDETHHGTSTGLLRPPRTDQNRDRRLEIRLLRYTVTTIPGRKVETSGVPIQDNVGSRMQLSNTR